MVPIASVLGPQVIEVGLEGVRSPKLVLRCEGQISRENQWDF